MPDAPINGATRAPLALALAAGAALGYVAWRRARGSDGVDTAGRAATPASPVESPTSADLRAGVKSHAPPLAMDSSASPSCADATTTTPPPPSPHAGVVVHVDERRRRRAASILDAPPDGGEGGPVIVGVAGGSGSGKTSIASLIAARLGSGCHVESISSDNYYIGLEPGVDAAAHNWDHPAAIEFPLLAAHLAALKAGRRVDVPTYDFAAHARTGRTLPLCGHAVDVVIVDGIFVLWSDEVRSLCDVTLFCSEDSDVCLARRLRRDLVERGRTVESVLAQYLRFVKPGFERFVAPSMANADFVIPRARDNVVAIDMLAGELARRVAARRGRA